MDKRAHIHVATIIHVFTPQNITIGTAPFDISNRSVKIVFRRFSFGETSYLWSKISMPILQNSTRTIL